MNIQRNGSQPAAKGQAVEWMEHVTDEEYAAGNDGATTTD